MPPDAVCHNSLLSSGDALAEPTRCGDCLQMRQLLREAGHVLDHEPRTDSAPAPPAAQVCINMSAALPSAVRCPHAQTVLGQQIEKLSLEAVDRVCCRSLLAGHAAVRSACSNAQGDAVDGAAGSAAASVAASRAPEHTPTGPRTASCRLASRLQPAACLWGASRLWCGPHWPASCAAAVVLCQILVCARMLTWNISRHAARPLHLQRLGGLDSTHMAHAWLA